MGPLKSWFRSRASNQKPGNAKPRRPRFFPALESLEARTLPTAGAFLQGTAFIDVNKDHTLDAGDPHLPSAIVSLYQGTGPNKVFLSSTATDATGAYLFQDNDPNDSPVITNLTPGIYTLVETPPSGFVADGTQILSQINPATQAAPNAIQVNLVDPTKLYLLTNSINFLNRNAWDYLQETFHFTGAGVTQGSPTITMTNTNPLAVGEQVTVSDSVTTFQSTIASIVPNASVTLGAAWPGSTGSSATVDETDTETAGQFPVTAGYIQATDATVTSGSGVVGNIADTSKLFIGERVNVSDAQAALDSTITAITPNTSITLADTWTDSSSNTATVLSDVNQPFLTLCWDLQHFLTDRFNNPPQPDTNLFQVLPTSGQGSPVNAGRIAYLFNHYGTAAIANSLPSESPAQAVGLQVALWELEYDGSFTDLQVLQETGLNSNSPAMELSQILTWANFYVNDSVGKSETATFLEANGSIEGGEQSMIATGSLNFGNLSTPATPAISTSQQPATATVGASIADKATVSGGSSPMGTVTFNLYNNPSATGTPLFTDANEPLVEGMATSKGYTATATGTDFWVATYNGDSNNSPVSSGPASEPVVITPATPSINTSQQPASATVGSVVADKATVSGGFNPTGTVTFNLYSNPNGTGTPLFTDTETVANGMATSKGYTTAAAGTDSWVATYNGDRNNSSVTSGTAMEPVVISPATPTISTSQQPASAAAGTSIADKATVSGGFNPTGTVTFNLYNNPSATGTPLFTDTEALVSATATSKGYTAIAAGTDYWVATYNGDSNNSPVTSGAALEPVTISPTVEVSVAKEASIPQAVFGSTLTYTFVVHNSGPNTATNVVLTDLLPSPGLSFVSAQPPSQGTVAFNPSTLQLTWSVGTLPVNGSAALQIVAQVTAIGPIVNTATVGSAEFDTNLANNVSSVTITGLQPPGQISKTSFLSSSAPPTGPATVATGISDPGFETPAEGSGPGAFAYDPTGSAWTFTGWAGLSGNGSAFTGSNPSAPQGNQVAFLQALSSISQSANLQAGSYIITLDAAQRANWQASFQSIGVYVDNNLVGTIRPTTTSYGAYSTGVFRVIAGNHVIRFAGLDPNGGDNTAFLDQITTQSAPLNQPFDPGFETPAQGSGPGAFTYNPAGSQWTFSGSAGLSGNGSAFTGSNPSAPQGSQVAFLQANGSISQSVNLAAGNYIITFAAAQRANWQASFQTIGEYVDNNLVGTIRPQGTSYGAYSTNMFKVTAGNHVIKFTGLDPNGGDNTAFLDQVFVQNTGVSQPLDAGFETPAQGSGPGAYTYAPSGSPWTFSSAAGLTGNGSAFTAGNANAPEGNQAAFLQGTGSISQGVNFTAGSYIITFDAAQRANLQASAQTISILVDGVVVGTVTPSGTTYGSYGSNRFTATTGKHTIAFVGLNLLGHDNTAFIDQVTISAF